MQYWQRKLQRSVTETRTSPIARPWPSMSCSRAIERQPTLPWRGAIMSPCATRPSSFMRTTAAGQPPSNDHLRLVREGGRWRIASLAAP
jgi:hypothetical protein